MKKQMQTFLSNHQFYQYLDWTKYREEIDRQIECSMSKNNESKLHFEKTWEKINISKPVFDYLVMELGGMYLRLYHCHIERGKIQVIDSRKIDFYQNQKKIYTPDILFTDLYEHLKDFIKETKPIPPLMVLSFANALKTIHSKQNRIDGEVLFWGKNHLQDGILGIKIGEKFENFLRERNLNLKINVTNDSSLAVLSARMLKDTTGTVINLIAGSGTNIGVGYNHGNNYKVINLEFGNFDFIPYSNFDHQLNHESLTPNRFRTEKLFSGAWQNKLLAIIIERAISEGIFEKEKCSERLKTMTSKELEIFFHQRNSELKCFSALQFTWREISKRGAFVCAITLARIINYLVVNKLTTNKITLIKVGALLENCTNFKNEMNKQLTKLLKENQNTNKIELKTCISSKSAYQGAAFLLTILNQK